MKIKVKSREEMEREYRELLKGLYKPKDFILTIIIILTIMVLMFGLIEAELWVASLIDSILK